MGLRALRDERRSRAAPSARRWSDPERELRRVPRSGCDLPGDFVGRARPQRRSASSISVISAAVMDNDAATRDSAYFARVDRFHQLFSAAQEIAAGAEPSELAAFANASEPTAARPVGTSRDPDRIGMMCGVGFASAFAPTSIEGRAMRKLLKGLAWTFGILAVIVLVLRIFA